MNKSIVLVAAVVLSFSAFAATKASKPTTLEEQEAKREAFRAKIAARTGGMIARPHTSGAKFVFVNAQKLVKTEEITAPVATMTRILRHDICLEAPVNAEPFSLSNVQSLMKAQQAKGAIFLIEDDVLPTVLVAPEAAWGVVNVRKLNEDKPGELILSQRTRREMWRAFAMVNGGGSNTKMGKCVMQSVFTLHDIDALGAEAFCPEPVNAVVAHLNKLGIKEYTMATYKVACEEGWAPAPTNDIQKAIWDKVHAMPATPIKIKPETKKVKE